MNHHASMNRIYRLVWSEVRSAWVPVAETARGGGKSGRARSKASRNLVAAAVSLALAPLAHAAPPLAHAASPCAAPVCGPTARGATSHPLGGKVVSGSATITQVGNTTDIRQSSADVAIDWLSFSIGSQATVDFLQPSASAVAVNRISSTNGSEILGHLDANGQLYLINPNGIIFGKGAEVNVGGLVASTLDVSDSSLSGSSRSFEGSGTGSIVNQGTITAADGGYVALIGNRVSNEGVISAQLGTVALGSGSAVTIDFSGDRLVHLQVDRSTLNNLAENRQLIEADGGLVIMTAGAQRALLASVVNNSGIIEARTIENHDGTIELLGGMSAGTVKVGGTLDASAPTGGNGGTIETDAAHVEVANAAKVTTAAPKGLTGSWRRRRSRPPMPRRRTTGSNFAAATHLQRCGGCADPIILRRCELTS
jgi:filamentous hemagglutinin family protein